MEAPPYEAEMQQMLGLLAEAQSVQAGELMKWSKIRNGLAVADTPAGSPAHLQGHKKQYRAKRNVDVNCNETSLKLYFFDQDKAQTCVRLLQHRSSVARQIKRNIDTPSLSTGLAKAFQEDHLAQQQPPQRHQQRRQSRGPGPHSAAGSPAEVGWAGTPPHNTHPSPAGSPAVRWGSGTPPPPASGVRAPMVLPDVGRLGGMAAAAAAAAVAAAQAAHQGRRGMSVSPEAPLAARSGQQVQQAFPQAVPRVQGAPVGQQQRPTPTRFNQQQQQAHRHLYQQVQYQRQQQQPQQRGRSSSPGVAWGNQQRGAAGTPPPLYGGQPPEWGLGAMAPAALQPGHVHMGGYQHQQQQQQQAAMLAAAGVPHGDQGPAGRKRKAPLLLDDAVLRRLRVAPPAQQPAGTGTPQQQPQNVGQKPPQQQQQPEGERLRQQHPEQERQQPPQPLSPLEALAQQYEEQHRGNFAYGDEGVRADLIESSREELGRGSYAIVYRYRVKRQQQQQEGEEETVIVKEWYDTSRFDPTKLVVLSSAGYHGVLNKHVHGVVDIIAADGKAQNGRVIKYRCFIKNHGLAFSDLQDAANSGRLTGVKLGDAPGGELMDSKAWYPLGPGRIPTQLQWPKQGLPFAAPALLLHKLLQLVHRMHTGADFYAYHCDLKPANVLIKAASLGKMAQHFIEAAGKVQEAAKGMSSSSEKKRVEEVLAAAFEFGGLFDKALEDTELVLLDKESMRINNMRPATPQEVWVDCGLAIFGSEEYMAPEVWAERGYPSKAVEAASTWSAMMYSIGRIVAALCAFCTDQYFPQELTYVTRLVPEDDNPEALDLFFNALNVPTGLANCLRWLLQQDPELRPKREQVAMMQFYHADCMSRHAFNTRLAWAQERADEGEVPEAANYSAYAASYVCSRPAVLDSVLECGGVKAPSE